MSGNRGEGARDEIGGCQTKEGCQEKGVSEKRGRRSKKRQAHKKCIPGQLTLDHGIAEPKNAPAPSSLRRISAKRCSGRAARLAVVGLLRGDTRPTSSGCSAVKRLSMLNVQVRVQL